MTVRQSSPRPKGGKKPRNTEEREFPAISRQPSEETQLEGKTSEPTEMRFDDGCVRPDAGRPDSPGIVSDHGVLSTSGMLSRMGGYTTAISELWFPPACRLCGDPVDSGQDFCVTCEQRLGFSADSMRTACRGCGRPRRVMIATRGRDSLDSGAESVAADHHCPRCRKEKYLFDQVVGLWTYQGEVRDAVVAAKFGHHAPLGDALGRRLADRASEFLRNDSPNMVVSVPIHWRRRIARRGSGNWVLAQSVARHYSRLRVREGGRKIPLVAALRTTRKIKKQAWLDDEARRRNVRGAFGLSRGYGFSKPRKSIVGQHILLVDDVLTTGATANEISGVLLEAGARKVSLAVVARAVWDC